jgi:hypothetical protein
MRHRLREVVKARVVRAFDAVRMTRAPLLHGTNSGSGGEHRTDA